METYRLNIDNVTNIEVLFKAGGLYEDIRAKEIILETSEVDFTPFRLKVTFIALCEGILNFNRKGPDDPKHEIDYEQFEIHDLKTLAKALTTETGIHFSSALVF